MKRELEILVTQLIAARAQIDATLAVLMPEECQHEKVIDLSTMGDPQSYRCALCGEERPQPFQPVEA